MERNLSGHPHFTTESKEIQESPEDRGVSAHDQAWLINHAPTAANEIMKGRRPSKLFRADTEAIFIHR